LHYKDYKEKLPLQFVTLFIVMLDEAAVPI